MNFNNPKQVMPSRNFLAVIGLVNVVAFAVLSFFLIQIRFIDYSRLKLPVSAQENQSVDKILTKPNSKLAGQYAPQLAANYLPQAVVTQSSWASDGSGWSQSRPATVNFNGNLYQLARGNQNKLYLRSIDYNGAAILTPWVEIPSSDTGAGPSVTVFQNRLWIAALGNHNLIYLNSTSDGQTFSGWIPVTTSVTNLSPTLQSFGDKLFLSAVGLDKKIYTANSPDGRTWSSWFTRDQDNTQYPVSLAVFNNQLYMGALGVDQKIYLRHSSDGQTWSDWQKDQESSSTDAPALTQANFQSTNGIVSRLFVIATGTGQRIFLRYLENNSWSPWHLVDTLTGSNTSMQTKTAVAVTTKLFPGENSDTLYILARRNDNQITWLFVRQV
jgi:hypothetical protein